jgi:sulfite dehydrogenase
MADFARSIPIAKARDTRTLLAYEMNGETLPVKHGFPLRLVVPGWVGAAWVKWVTSISALDREHDGFWMKRAYRHPVAPLQPGTAVAPEQMRPVTSLVVKSVIAAPVDGAQVVRGKPVTVRGVAWSGDVGPVIRVEVSVDAGRSWRAATLRNDQRTSFGWRQWEYTWTPDREAFHTILARARDAAGNTQPFDQEWNPSGYAWNVVPRVGVNVAKDASSHERTPASAPVSAAAVAPPASYKGSCLVCHDADVIEQQRLTRPQWDAEINKMTGWGAQVADADRRALLDYLANAFGPRLRRAP